MIAAAQKAKGPAEAATSPDRGSNNPTGDQEMNKAVDITPATKTATDAAVASAMRDLDGDLLDLVHMARIATNIAERILNRPHKKEGDVGVFHLDLDDRDGFLFSLGDVERRACSLKRRYYAAWNGEAVQ